jgi:hypothetical protein
MIDRMVAQARAKLAHSIATKCGIAHSRIRQLAQKIRAREGLPVVVLDESGNGRHLFHLVQPSGKESQAAR